MPCRPPTVLRGGPDNANRGFPAFFCRCSFVHPRTDARLASRAKNASATRHVCRVSRATSGPLGRLGRRQSLRRDPLFRDALTLPRAASRTDRATRAMNRRALPEVAMTMSGSGSRRECVSRLACSAVIADRSGVPTQQYVPADVLNLTRSLGYQRGPTPTGRCARRGHDERPARVENPETADERDPCSG